MVSYVTGILVSRHAGAIPSSTFSGCVLESDLFFFRVLSSLMDTTTLYSSFLSPLSPLFSGRLGGVPRRVGRANEKGEREKKQGRGREWKRGGGGRGWVVRRGRESASSVALQPQVLYSFVRCDALCVCVEAASVQLVQLTSACVVRRLFRVSQRSDISLYKF